MSPALVLQQEAATASTSSCTNSATTSKSGEEILVSFSVTIGAYLNVTSLKSLSKTNRACYESFWQDENLWQEAVVQEQLFLFPNQESSLAATAAKDDEDEEDEELPTPQRQWRDLAMTIQNVLEGRYRVALLDPKIVYIINEDSDSDYELPDSSSDDDSESSDGDDEMNVDDRDMDVSLLVDDLQERAQDFRPATILMNGRSVLRKNSLQRHLVRAQNWSRGPHHWWAGMLYQHYHEDIRFRTGSVIDSNDLEPWSYDHPPAANAAGEVELGTMRSCPLSADSNGVLVFTSWREDLVVVDMCEGDRIVRRLDGFQCQDWHMGEDFVIELTSSTSADHHITCQYDLVSDESSVRTASLDITQAQSEYGSICCVRGDYSLAQIGGRVVYLVQLERSLGTLRVVYQSDRMVTEIKHLLATTASMDHRVGQRTAFYEREDRGGSRRNQSIEEEENDDDDDYFQEEIMVLGRLLFVFVSWRSQMQQQRYVVVVDMKEDTVLYGICLGVRDVRGKVLGSQFRGGVLPVRGSLGSSTVGILFGPCLLPRMDATHCDLFRLYEAAFLCAKENPFHRHPNTRLSLHELIGARRSSRKLCNASDQSFLFHLHFELLTHNMQVHTTPLVILNAQGELCGKQLTFLQHTA